MAALFPVSVNPSPPLDSPPKCVSGQTMIADLPIFLACTAAITPALVPP
jgi:hypothetical protein